MSKAYYTYEHLDFLFHDLFIEEELEELDHMVSSIAHRE